MKKFIIYTFLLILCGCSKYENYKVLSVENFYNELNVSTDPLIIDVRTSEEFSKGHLENALNIDWNGKEFEDQITILNNERPVFIYCLSGGRSSKASNKMIELNFKNISELKGGIIEWRKNFLPEEIINTDDINSLSISQFNNLITSDKLVLIDYYAKWCAPCKVMEPFLDEISNEKVDVVKLVRIDYDENLPLIKNLGIYGLPVIQLYSNNKLLWSKEGFIDKKNIELAIDKFLKI